MNPIGKAGAFSLMNLNTNIGTRVDINISECNLGIIDSTLWFDIEKLDAKFTLDLSKPYERAIFLEITYLLIEHMRYKLKYYKITPDPINEPRNIQDLNLVVKVEEKNKAINLNNGIVPNITTIRTIASDIENAKLLFQKFDFDSSGYLDK
jgi:hypothetical protein